MIELFIAGLIIGFAVGYAMRYIKEKLNNLP